MNYLPLGIIGHVDHGKTALVRALTGAETDRLDEERERGISIVLGYAQLTLPSGEMGIIDAPGHERFIRTMIAGATGCEAILLCVDVNEGVKPQTVEHLEIARLLGVRDAVIAVTKCDIAQSGRREETAEELEILLDGGPFQSAPLVYTSSETGEGIVALRAELDAILSHSTPLKDEGFPYLPIDRVFTMEGFGTVVTGTLRRGALTADQALAVYPAGTDVQVRDMQSHGAKTERAEPGRRTAVNLRGVSKSDLNRGDVLAAADSIRVTDTLDVELELLASAPSPLKHRQPVRVLFGAKEAMARTHLLGADAVEPGERAFLQLRFDEPVAALHYEPFILRFYSPMTTIGGGRVLDSPPQPYSRKDAAAGERMQAYASRELTRMAAHALSDAGNNGLDAGQFAIGRRVDVTAVCDAMAEAGAVALRNDTYIDSNCADAVAQTILDVVQQYHRENPTARGIPSSEIGARVADVPSSTLEGMIERLINQSKLAQAGGDLHLPSFTPEGALSETDRNVVDTIEAAFREGGLIPPDPRDAVPSNGDKLFRWLIREGVLVAAKTDARGQSAQHIVFHRDAIDAAKRNLSDKFSTGDAFTASDARSVLETSRKYLIPLLELLDRAQFTKRNGNTRTLTGR